MKEPRCCQTNETAPGNENLGHAPRSLPNSMNRHQLNLVGLFRGSLSHIDDPSVIDSWHHHQLMLSIAKSRR